MSAELSQMPPMGCNRAKVTDYAPVMLVPILTSTDGVPVQQYLWVSITDGVPVKNTQFSAASGGSTRDFPHFM